MSKKLVIGILAHVDAGKTTLSEAFLYLTGRIRALGRVDHQDAFLDHFSLERSRGITIFSKQAEFSYTCGKEDRDTPPFGWTGDSGSAGEQTAFTLLDTPGHTDFAAEMERTLQVLDLAVLVISGPDGVQGHTETLWKLLEQYRVPTFVFVNKMDQPGTDASRIMEELNRRLSGNCISFSGTEERDSFLESIALCDEAVMEAYLEHGQIEEAEVAGLIRNRRLFPCFFGSALKLEGVEALLEGMARFTVPPAYPEEFGARVYKISRDEQGNRLTHMKITGGCLRVRDTVKQTTQEDTDPEEKISQIRVISGAKYEAVPEIHAGEICAVTGLSRTWAGQALGAERGTKAPVLTPVLTYRMILPEGCDVHKMIRLLRTLEEEEPQLHVEWKEELQEIHVQVMGEVQTEILQQMILERSGVQVTFGEGAIVYRETISGPVQGAGHFEPLRHYAEVHLLLEPGERGSGITVESQCSTDVLDLNWQRLIATHILEREHPGVLTGAPVTDLRVTILSGRAHLKHTEGGDFRQATYRAVRQGLKKAQRDSLAVLLEPWYRFRLTVPAGSTGRAMTDIQRMGGTCEPGEMDADLAVLAGTVPVSTARGYQREVSAYTHGRGQFFCLPDGYRPCHNAQEVIEAAGYDSELDADNPTGSVFCAHGAGYAVRWDEADAYMHIQTESGREQEGESTADEAIPRPVGMPSDGIDYKDRLHNEDELRAIFARTYGTREEENRNIWKRRRGEIARSAENASAASGKARGRSEGQGTQDGRDLSQEKGSQDGRKGPADAPGQRINHRAGRAELPEYLLVDGYNIIFAWEELSSLASRDIAAARTRLMDLMSNYQGFAGCELILVFDAYHVEGHPGEIFDYHNIHVVYTAEAETADQYIEKTVRNMRPKYKVTVATSDRLEQVIILGEGAHRLSASDFLDEVTYAQKQIREITREARARLGKNYLFDTLDEEMAALMEDVRLGRREL